jgi:hypothetical protein
MKNTELEEKPIRRKPAPLKAWTEGEVKRLIKEYKAERTRSQIVTILGRTEGSVANMIRTLILRGTLAGRRPGRSKQTPA